MYEKYLALARDATASGDRIAAEGFYQFAEHYYRLVNDSTDPHPDGQRRYDQNRDGMPPRGEHAHAGDGSQHQPAAARGNGAASNGDGAASPAESEAMHSGDEADAAGEPRGEAGPRRRGLRRRKPANGNGAAPSDDEGNAQELASSDSDKDMACP